MGLRGPKPQAPEDYFWDRVTKGDGCWAWKGPVNNYGYGVLGCALGPRTTAHRYAYELLVGPVPDDLHVDHLCRNRVCVNPAHLEAVTCRENLLRGIGFTAINAAKTHCKRGHPFNEENTHIRASGKRQCRVCDRDAHRLKAQQLRTEVQLSEQAA